MKPSSHRVSCLIWLHNKHSKRAAVKTWGPGSWEEMKRWEEWKQIGISHRTHRHAKHSYTRSKELQSAQCTQGLQYAPQAEKLPLQERKRLHVHKLTLLPLLQDSVAWIMFSCKFQSPSREIFITATPTNALTLSFYYPPLRGTALARFGGCGLAYVHKTTVWFDLVSHAVRYQPKIPKL